jgi:hypothetical protein
MLKFLSQRGFLIFNESTQQVTINTKDDISNYSQSFLYHLLLPLVESYWLTLVYFISYDNRHQSHDQDLLYNKIQWLIESLYTAG